MNKIPTPDTDAELKGINADCNEDHKFNAMTDHARKLERERDDAVCKYRNLYSIFEGLCRSIADGGEKHHQEIHNLRRERDEARNTGEAFSALAWRLEKERNDARKERDEARDALDCLLAVIGLTPIVGNKDALQQAVYQGLVVLRKLEGPK